MKKIFPLPRTEILIFTGCLAALVWAVSFVAAHNRGWDARVYCAAAEVDRSGGNPYDPQLMPSSLPYVYPPGLLPFISWLCTSALDFENLYGFYYLILVAGTVWLWTPGHQWPVASLFAFGGLAGGVWTFWTGNLEIFWLVLVSFFYRAASNQRPAWAGFWLGIAAAVKLMPAVYLLLILLLPGTAADKWRGLAVGLFSMAFVWTGLLALRPHLIDAYLASLQLSLSGMRGPGAEYGSFDHPAFPYFMAALAGVDSSAGDLVPGFLMSLVVALFLGGLCAQKLRKEIPDSYTGLLPLALGFLILSLCMPRMKPYSFVLLAPSLFILWNHLHATRKKPGFCSSPLLTPFLRSDCSTTGLPF